MSDKLFFCFIVLAGVVFGVFFGVFVTKVVLEDKYVLSRMDGESMSKEGVWQRCIGIMEKRKNFNDGDKVCFFIDVYNASVCHRCYKINDSFYDFYCYGDNENSTKDMVKRDWVEGVILREVCLSGN